ETGPYVQYTHARCASVLRNAAEKFGDAAPKAGDAEGIRLSSLLTPAAYELTKLIYTFPDAVEDACRKYEPSVITRHIIRVAQGFNKFYHDEHILVDDAEERKAKLLLTYASMQTIRNGLGLLGVKAPERM
ncbi:MAG: arginine--tRNA ligase, partial [Firmicutes bacterium]|nr:arginine--tRNA ligase [Bacillota bacterium]